MYRDDQEALRARLAALEASLEAERRAREAAEAATRAARARANELQLTLRRQTTPSSLRPWLLIVLLAAAVCAVLVWPRAEQPRATRHAAPAHTSIQHPCANSGQGYLVANTFPWARILVDGKDTGMTTPVPAGKRLALPPGPHRLTFLVDGHRFSQTVEIKAGRTTRILRRLPVPPGPTGSAID
ncbi:MAG: PEGA domain-containing protein [Deltaproteobacteria bacterium]|jgi:hypothetical protein|nr:PEGA domain-containing protein [Deltaproteobacteria bacterium]